MTNIHDEKKDIAIIENGNVDSKLSTGGAESFVIDPVVEKRLMRKVDLHLFPAVWVMLLMNYIDRTNIGNAKIGSSNASGGMEKDLNMTSGDYSLVLSIFYVSYLLFEIPSNMLIAKSSPKIFLPALMFTWGAVSIAAKGCKSTAAMAGFRFVLGAIEAGFYPGVSFLMSCWYKPEEMSRRQTIFYSATLIAGAFGGLLAGGIMGGMEGLAGTRGWHWLFIIEGLATCVVASGAYFVLPNYPHNTSWLTEEEKMIAKYRLLSADSDGEEKHVGHLEGLKLAFSDPRTWCMLFTYNVIACSGTISYFIPTLMKSLGYKDRNAQFMTVPIYAVALVMSLSGGYIADKTQQKAFVIAAAGTLATIAYVICTVVQNPKVKYAMICFGAGGVWTVIPIFLSWVVIMFDGREKRAVAIAAINGFGNLSSIWGSFFWPKEQAPKYVMGFAITCALCASAVVVVLFTKWRFGDRGVERTA